MLKNWQHNVLLVRGISCYSAVCGFRFPDQSGEYTCPRCNQKLCHLLHAAFPAIIVILANSYSIVAWSNLFSHRLPSHLPADCINIRLFVFNLLLPSVWRIFYPHLSWRDFSFKCFVNKTVTFVAIYPKRLFIVHCPTFLFSKRVRSLVELWIYI